MRENEYLIFKYILLYYGGESIFRCHESKIFTAIFTANNFKFGMAENKTATHQPFIYRQKKIRSKNKVMAENKTAV